MSKVSPPSGHNGTVYLCCGSPPPHALWTERGEREERNGGRKRGINIEGGTDRERGEKERGRDGKKRGSKEITE